MTKGSDITLEGQLRNKFSIRFLKYCCYNLVQTLQSIVVRTSGENNFWQENLVYWVVLFISLKTEHVDDKYLEEANNMGNISKVQI